MTPKKKSKGISKGKIQFEETGRASEPDLAGMSELSHWKFKTTMTNMLGALMEKVGGMQEQMSKVKREMEILSENQKEMLEIKKRCKGNEECL